MPTPSDLNFVQAAVKSNWVTGEKAKDALQALKQVENLGGKASISDVFVKKGYLTPEQAAKLSKSLGLERDAVPEAPKIGDFEILRRIGAGGMGAVYLARHANGAVVALKVLPEHLASDADYVGRFQREAAIAYQMDHPNIVKCLAAGEAGGHHYLALDYIEGGNVMDRLKDKRPIPEAESLGIVNGVCQALQYAHERSVVHRDIKPANILLTREGVPKLSDLGLARAAGDLTVTQTGMILGTPHYMSPEQAMGQKDLDIRSDLYSLGATLYHMVCGEPPFAGDTALVLIHQHLKAQLPSPAEKNPLLSEGICQIIEKCMAKDPADRYQTPVEMIEDVQSVASGGEPKSSRLDPNKSSVRQRVISTEAVKRYRETRRAGVTQEAKAHKSVAAILVAGVLIAAIAIGFALIRKGENAQPSSGVPATASTSVAQTNIATPIPATAVGKGQSPARPDAPAAATATSSRPQPNLERVTAVFNEAQKYAEENPEDFQEILKRFEAVGQSAGGTEYDNKAKEQIQSWQAKREQSAQTELEGRRIEVQKCLDAGRFSDAVKLWEQFPENLATENSRKPLNEEKSKVREAVTRASQQIGEGSKLLLGKKPEELTEEDVKAMKSMQERGRLLEDALSAQEKTAFAAVLRDIEKLVKAREESLASPPSKGLEEVWERFSEKMKARRFDEAESFLGQVAKVETSPELKRLAEDVQVLKGLFARAESNLGLLEGKMVRVQGGAMKVLSVRGSKIYVKQGEVEMGFGLEKLELTQILELALAKENDPKAKAYEKALFEFFLVSPEKAKAALEEARGQGADVALYETRLNVMEEAERETHAEKEAAGLVKQIKSAIEDEQVESAKSKLEKLEKDFGGTEAGKSHLARLREEVALAESHDRVRKNLILIPAGNVVEDAQDAEGKTIQKKVYVPSFYIGKYETSNGEYEEFRTWLRKELEKGDAGDPHRYCYPGHLPDGRELSEKEFRELEKMPVVKRKERIIKTGLVGSEPEGTSHVGTPQSYGEMRPSYSKFPVFDIGWPEAWAYCRWRGGILPTPMQWKKAGFWNPKTSRWRRYPWGDTFVNTLSNLKGDADGFPGYDTAPIDHFPDGASAYGCLNMLGNVQEVLFNPADFTRTNKERPYMGLHVFVLPGANPFGNGGAFNGFRMAKSHR